MNWDMIGAIGEVVGAGGMIATLFYFGLQLRRNQQATIASGISTSHQTELSVEAKLEENAELICKANRGDLLTEEEQFRVSRLSAMVGKDAFYKYLQITTRSGATRMEVVVHNLASVLTDNPCLKSAWLEQEDVYVERRKDIADYEIANQWVSAVKKELERLDT